MSVSFDDSVFTVTSPNSASPDQRYRKLEDDVGASPKPATHIRFVCISDTHGKHRMIEDIPDGDVLLHAGDITNTGEPEQLKDFDEWMGGLPHRHKVVIAGNHDVTIHDSFYEDQWKRFHFREKKDSKLAQSYLKNSSNFVYLEDSECEVLGYHIYGSPWQPTFFDWAFNVDLGEPCAAVWRKIPTHTDVLITHGPPAGHGDLCSHGGRAGCLDLLRELQERIKPSHHVFGHIHEGYGMSSDGTTTYVNASTCTLRYQAVNPPLVFDLPVRST